MQLVLIAVALTVSAAAANAQDVSGAPLRLAQSIPLPGVEGRIDHCAVDVAGSRLFLCALGNNSLEIIDLAKGERVQTITGLGRPQGIAYIPELSRIYVANDEGGICNFYDAQSFALLGTANFGDDADNIRYDNAAKQIYVGFGKGGLGILDADTGRNLGRIKLSGHPEEFDLEKEGSRIFVDVPATRQVVVVDRSKREVIATWKTDAASQNFPMAFDESNHRLFLGCRSPAKLVVLRTDSGAVVADVGIGEDIDDIFYDGKRHRIYAICGGGTVDVIEQVDPDHYRSASRIPTAPGARTGLFVPELNSLFVAVPHRGKQSAELRRYSVD